MDIFRQLVKNQFESENANPQDSQNTNDNFDEFLESLKEKYRKRKISDNVATINDPQKLLSNFISHLCFLFHNFLLRESIKLNNITHQFHSRRSNEMNSLVNGNPMSIFNDISIFSMQSTSRLVGIVFNEKEIYYFQYSHGKNALVKVLSQNWDFKSASIQVDSINDAIQLLLKTSN